jgi:hypothetical protein
MVEEINGVAAINEYNQKFAIRGTPGAGEEVQCSRSFIHVEYEAKNLRWLTTNRRRLF